MRNVYFKTENKKKLLPKTTDRKTTIPANEVNSNVFLNKITNNAGSHIYPWRKFRIEIHSEPLRNFPNHPGIYLYPNQTFSFRSNPKKFFNPNQSEDHSKSIRMNPVTPTETKFFGIIRIDSDRPDSFGLKVRIDSDLPDSFGLKVRIDSDLPESFGLKVRINSD